jgi:hypothetical protein
MRAFDKDQSGRIDYLEFYTVLTQVDKPPGYVILFSRRSNIVQFDRRTFLDLSAVEAQCLVDQYEAVAREHDQVDVRLDALDLDYIPAYLKSRPIDNLIFPTQDEANRVATQVIELAIAKVSKGSVGGIPCEASPLASADAEYALEFRVPETSKNAGNPIFSADGLATYTASVSNYLTLYSTMSGDLLFNIVVSKLSCRVVASGTQPAQSMVSTERHLRQSAVGFGRRSIEFLSHGTADDKTDSARSLRFREHVHSANPPSRWAHLHCQSST